jgi:hypothetical protein
MMAAKETAMTNYQGRSFRLSMKGVTSTAGLALRHGNGAPWKRESFSPLQYNYQSTTNGLILTACAH